MLLTVTMNPSIDVAYTLDHLTLDTTNRVANVHKTAGGKGLNVARVATLLGHETTATGVLGGHFGAFIEDQLNRDHITHSFQPIPQETRQCVAILHDNGTQTELLEAGPALTAPNLLAFEKRFTRLLERATTVTLSGSLPQGVAPAYYAHLIALAASKNVKVILDASGAALQAGIQGTSKPTLIKPNEAELAALIHQPVKKADLAQLKTSLSLPMFADIPWVVVSLGAAGALIKHQRSYYQAIIPKIAVVNPVGSGDATLAGLAVALDNNEPDTTVIKTAMTAGLLNTMQAKTGFIDASQFSNYFNQVTVRPL